MFSISEVIDMAVQLEKNGEWICRSAMDYVSDAGLKQLLEWMAEEENRHAKWLSSLSATAVKICLFQERITCFLGLVPGLPVFSIAGRHPGPLQEGRWFSRLHSLKQRQTTGSLVFHRFG